MIISENIPSANRGNLVLGAFGFQALGALGGTGVGCLVLMTRPGPGCLALDVCDRHHPGARRHARPLLHRRKRQLAAVRGAHDKAEQSVTRLLARKPQYPKDIKLRAATLPRARSTRQAILSWRCSTSRNRRATIFASVPWFIQDLGTYGIGIFTPIILAAAHRRRLRPCPQPQRPDR